VYCPNCGNEIKKNQKYCTYCGSKAESSTMQKGNTKSLNIRVIAYLIPLLLVVLIIGFITKLSFNPNVENNNNNITASLHKTAKSHSEILLDVDNYQIKYWRIIKRHDVLLMTWSDDDKEKDKKELDKLFKEIENKIDKNNYYLLQYKSIKREYENNPGQNTIEMNDFASKEYDAVDKLLNDVYQNIKTKISQEDFKELTASEIKWIKDVESYHKVFEEQGFGTIGTLVYYNYQLNMRRFRTLLLMLYL